MTDGSSQHSLRSIIAADGAVEFCRRRMLRLWFCGIQDVPERGLFSATTDATPAAALKEASSKMRR